MKASNMAPKVSLVDQPAKLDLEPDQIKYVGISHYHGDHTGQVASFPQGTLIIQHDARDVEKLAAFPAGAR